MEWAHVAATVGKGMAAYLALVAALKITGNRTLAKLKAFDFVVTIALGSILAAMFTPDLPLVHGLAALVALVTAQWLVAKASSRHPRFASWVSSEPTPVFRDGRWLDDELRRARITRPEVEGAMREAGHEGPSTVASVVLETNGSLTVTPLRAAAGPNFYSRQ